MYQSTLTLHNGELIFGARLPDGRFVVYVVTRDGINPTYCPTCGALIGDVDPAELRGAISGQIDLSAFRLPTSELPQRAWDHYPSCPDRKSL